jgi:hypothetical protein
MSRKGILTSTVIAAGLAMSVPVSGEKKSAPSGSYDDLVKLFVEWRAFETPPLLNGAPDYTAATFATRHAQLKSYQDRLAAFDSSRWSIPQRVDRELLRAEMNGFDFYVRVLKPWERDPAYYLSLWMEQSDTPAHEGPTNHAAIELWTYSFPLTRDAARRLLRELNTIPPLLAQARGNLTGNARDLWITGTGTIEQQISDLAVLEQRAGAQGAEFRSAVRAAQRATREFVGWLQQQAPKKTGPSGIGKEAYTWQLQNVHLVPLTWEDEVTILQRELARAHASLKLEETRNRSVAPIAVVQNDGEYQQRANAAVTRFIDFLRKSDFMTVHEYMDPALRARLGKFVPEESRNFFAIATHHDPLTLYTHFYHWWDLARMRTMPYPSPIRRGPLLYNIWDSRAEGMATAMEELMLHAGLFDDNPRAREIVWIMLAQRAARGLASLYAHANEFDIARAKTFQVEWTPRGWMRPDLDLLGFEQQLYLRQPGYGTSYIVGKHLIEELISERAKQLGAKFSTREFFAEFDAAGLIPVSLLRWELTGNRGAAFMNSTP